MGANIVLVAVIALLLSISTVSTETSFGTKRLVRANSIYSGDDSHSSSASNHSEERAGAAVSGLVSVKNMLGQKLTSAGKWVKVELWLEARKTPEFAKQALGLEKLSDKALKAHKNYKYFEYFLKKDEKYKIIGWIQEKLSSFEVWNLLKMEDIPASALKSTNEYRMYTTFVLKTDKFTLSSLENNLPPPSWFRSTTGSAAELLTKADIWAHAGRPRSYVMKSLGMDTWMNEEALKMLKTYEYLQYYDNIMQAIAAAEKAEKAAEKAEKAAKKAEKAAKKAAKKAEEAAKKAKKAKRAMH